MENKDREEQMDPMSLAEQDALALSIRNLPGVEVPPNFLPNVMYQVYEVHHREKISFPLVAGVCVLLLILCAGFFAWDVQLFAEQVDAPSFSAAFDQKLDEVSTKSDKLSNDIAAVFSASWQIITAAMGYFFTNTSTFVQILIFSGIIALAILARKWMAGLRIN